MSLFRNIVFISALAGLVAGLAMTAMQYASTIPLIVAAETYETAEPATPHVHAPAAAGAAVALHSHDEDAWAPQDGFERSAFTALANIVTAIGFAILLVTASEFAGGLSGWRQGIFWGLAGFAAFTVAPGLGLPPELPGMPAAEIGSRQMWWVGTVAATAAGMAFLVYRRTLPFAILGMALIVAPHLIGAPKPDSFESAVPHGLAHDFIVMVSVVSLLFWVLLGASAGYIRSRFMQRA